MASTPTTAQAAPRIVPRQRRVDIAIVGGGIAGVMLAIGLQRYPHLNPQVYEAAKAFGEVGAGLGMGPNAQRAMAAIDPRILEGYHQRAAKDDSPAGANGRYAWTTVHKGQGADEGEFVVEHGHATRGTTIHRAHLLDELVRLLEPSRAHFGKRLQRVYAAAKGEDTGDAPIGLTFADGSSAWADVVVGADGVHSAVREHVLGEQHPAARAFFTGTVQYRATVPMERAEAALGPLDQRLPQMCGDNGLVFGMPLAERTLYYISATIGDTQIALDGQPWVNKADLHGLRAHFAGWSERVRKTVDLFPDDGSTMAWSVWEMPPAPTYWRGRVVLMGDAAHASTPFQGAGAGQAVEDALILEKLLGRYLDPARSGTGAEAGANKARTRSAEIVRTVGAVMQAYDTVRRFRSQKVVTTSREIGRILTCRDPVVGNKAETLGAALQGRLNWIWDWNCDEAVKDAFQLVDEILDAAARLQPAKADLAEALPKE